MKYTFIALMLGVFLTGCSSTWNGVKEDSSEIWDATKEKSSEVYHGTKKAIHDATDEDN